MERQERSMQPTRLQHRSCTGSRSAYYFPDGSGASLYDSISPVNSFRVVFNHYFGVGYQLLEDLSYYSSAEYPYQFSNVTARISEYIGSNKDVDK